MHVISPSILELVVRIRAAHNRPGNHIRVRISSPEIRIVSLHAPDKVLFPSVRYYGCGPVVNPERVLRPEPDQVAPARRVQPENVIDLRFGEREELVGPHRPPLAAEHATGGPEVVGVDGHEERGGGDVLEVVPTADEEQPARRAAHVSGIVLVQIGAYVVFCFGLIFLQDFTVFFMQLPLYRQLHMMFQFKPKRDSFINYKHRCRTNLLCMVEEKVRVMRVCWAEHDGRCRHCRGGLGRHVGAGVALVDFVGSPRRRHVFRPLPTVVIRVAVTYLN
nr:hypothetical protein VIGAN_03027600 [Ipomoea batatas]